MDGGNPATPGAGRFALKSANGVTACSAGNDIFRNGFE
jgi:hypothetical protein